MKPRPPVVSILGHVDHGKTTLLDFIRKSRITAKEHGGITQKIGAYEVSTRIKGYPTDKITFIDTPGHEAFTKLRSRGAEVSDIAILVVDTKDSVKPQTVESISHIKEAKIPFIVALNKIDLAEANPEKVKNELLKHEVMVEGKGGKVPVLELSAKSGKGVAELLETILLLSSDLNLKYDEKADPKAYIIETKKDKRGVTATIIIKDGRLKIGDTIFAGSQRTKVRSMINDDGKTISEAYPSTPFELLGFAELPEVGSIISPSPSQAIKQKEQLQKKVFDLESFLKTDEPKKLNLIIKTDSQGSLEAISSSLDKTKGFEIILTAVGDVNKSDIFLAKTAKAIVIAFSVRSEKEAVDLAKQEKVIIKSYNIIYELIEELTEVTKLMREKEESELNLKGEAKVLATFIIQDEKVFGIRVTKGKANLNDPTEIYRDGKLVGKSQIVSMKIRAKNVNEAKKDQEAGVIIPNIDIKVGDMIKFIL